MQFELNPEEQDFLKNLLEEDCQELRTEIRKTENHEFKAALRIKEQLMVRMLQRLSGQAIAKSV